MLKRVLLLAFLISLSGCKLYEKQPSEIKSTFKASKVISPDGTKSKYSEIKYIDGAYYGIRRSQKVRLDREKDILYLYSYQRSHKLQTGIIFGVMTISIVGLVFGLLVFSLNNSW